MQLAAFENTDRVIPATPLTPTLECTMAHLAMSLNVPALILQKLMFDALRFPVVHKDMTQHTQLQVHIEDALLGNLLPIPPLMLSFLEEGAEQDGQMYHIPLLIDAEHYASYLSMLARAQWVLTRGGQRICVPLFFLCQPEVSAGMLALANAFPIGELVRSERESTQAVPYFRFFEHRNPQQGFAIAIYDDASQPVSHFGSLFSLHRALVAQRNYIYESLRLGFAPVLVPRLCDKGLPMRYQAVQTQGDKPLGIELRTFEAFQELAIRQGSPDIWIDDGTPTADLYGGHQGLISHWRQLELMVQREGCLPIRQRFLTVLQDDRSNGRVQVRLETPLLARDEFLHEDDLL